MDRPLLSICIPTYSRAHFLRECLESITGQFSDSQISSQVEIAISDNASTDNTEELVKSCQNKYQNIRYSRNASNLGYDRNVSAVLALGQGQFLWLMSDDEMIAAGALKFLLFFLASHRDIGYFCVDHGGLNRKFGDYELFNNGNAWLRELGLTGGLISQNIYNSDFLPADISKYYDNLWIHFSIALEILAGHHGMLVKKLFLDPQIPRKTTWAGGGHGFNTYNCLNEIIRQLPALGYDPKIISRLLTGMAAGLPKNAASAKIHDLKITVSGLKTLFREYKPHPFWLAAALLVYFTPNVFLKLIKRP